MKEISYYKYILDKDIQYNKIRLIPNRDIELHFTKISNIHLYPRLWSVITNDLFIFSDFERYLSPYKHHKEIIGNQNKIKKISKSIPMIKGNFFLFGGEENYWHFIIDFIPRLICLNQLSETELHIIIPENLPEKFIQFIIKLTKLMNINKISFLKINRNHLIYSFENLIFTSKPSISFTSYFFYKLLGNTILKEKKINLYIKRGNTLNRRVLNEDKIIDLLKKYNYFVIDCSQITIEDQIQHFSKAKNIIIPSGASMANLLFIPDKINVVEIRSNLDGDFSKRINLDDRFFLYHFEKTIKVGKKLRKDIIVDIQELKKLIEQKKIF